MDPLEKIRHLLFLTYLTGYNLQDISNLEDRSPSYLINYLVKKGKGLISVGELSKQIEKANYDADFALEYCRYQNINIEPYYSANYPIKLIDLRDRPPLLYYKGILPQVDLTAVVGTRKFSEHAIKNTFGIVEAFRDQGYGIVSGLALGIDTIAHQAAIENKAYTLAVLPTSLESVYPKANMKLANKILDEGGALLSELIFGINRGKKSFVERNRIQSALSHNTIPVEMAKDSGTMHTIRFSMTQKRNVFVIKPTLDQSLLAQYEGINYLISEQKKAQRSNIFIAKDIRELHSKIIQSKSSGDQLKLF